MEQDRVEKALQFVLFQEAAAKAPSRRVSRLHYGSTEDGTRYLICRGATCYECGQVIDHDQDVNFVKTGLCVDCWTEQKEKVQKIEQAMLVSSLQEDAFRRHILQRAGSL